MTPLRYEDLLMPDWDAPAHVKAFSTTRCGGVSKAPYDSFNLGDHVGDRIDDVHHNRQRLQHLLSFPTAPCWLNQVHSNKVVNADVARAAHGTTEPPQADASFSCEPGVVCVVLTADCLPVLFTDKLGQVVAAAHAGWRGLADGVLEATVEAMNVPNPDVLAWLGPAIGPAEFEVGAEVREQFIKHDAEAQAAFIPINDHALTKKKYLADMVMLAKQKLRKIGVNQIWGGGFCTYQQESRFFSYRRDKQTGRMASLIWLGKS